MHKNSLCGHLLHDKIKQNNGRRWGQNVEAYYYGACLTQAVHSIFKALEIEKYRLSGCPFVISFTGGGGKTSLIRRMAWEGRELGLKVLVIPTTHMAPSGAFLCRNLRWGLWSRH